MPHFGPVSRRVLIKTLRTLGFEGPKPGRRHMFMERGTVTVVIPNPHEGDIGIGLLKRILEQAEITREEWEAI